MSDRADIYPKRYLLTPGPTPLPPAVSQVMAQPLPYHHSPEFVDTYSRCLESLARVFQTQNQVLSYAASGTGAMEAAVANLAVPGEPVLVATAGKFGERWKALADAYGADVTHLDLEWGEKIDPGALAEAIVAMPRRPRIVFTTQSETSTGVVHDVRGLTEAAHEAGAVICIDAVSGLGAVDLPQDEWGVDVVIAGSQKALMSPPGLAFASVGERAMAIAAERPGRRYYFDWELSAKSQAGSSPESPFTPAVTLWMALDVALGLILEEGLSQVFERHAILARAARAGIAGLGLERFGPDDDGANVLTVAAIPDSIDGPMVPKLARERYGVTLAGGQNRIKGKIVRIAHCGYFGAFDMIIAISALDLALRDLGWEAEPGAGAQAAHAVFAEAGSPVPLG